jgi:hypothetical protein
MTNVFYNKICELSHVLAILRLVNPPLRVVYFNLGTHHIPNSGDIPNTLMTTSASSVMLVPHNFHDRDPSRESAQGVKLAMKKPGDGETDVKYYGAKYTEGFEVDLVSFYCQCSFICFWKTVNIHSTNFSPTLSHINCRKMG